MTQKVSNLNWWNSKSWISGLLQCQLEPVAASHSIASPSTSFATKKLQVFSDIEACVIAKLHSRLDPPLTAYTLHIITERALELQHNGKWGPVVEVLVANNTLNSLVVVICCSVFTRQGQGSIENVQALVLHRAHVKVLSDRCKACSKKQQTISWVSAIFFPWPSRRQCCRYPSRTRVQSGLHPTSWNFARTSLTNLDQRVNSQRRETQSIFDLNIAKAITPACDTSETQPFGKRLRTPRISDVHAPAET